MGQEQLRVISKAAAIEAGGHKYYTGVPCKLGHLSERYTLNSVCIACHRLWKHTPEYSREYNKRWREQNAEKNILTTTRVRCKRAGIPFNLTLDDIVIPPSCPVLGIPLRTLVGQRDDSTPSIDRLVPELGYVKGNVRIISWRANRIKNDATLEELEAIVAYMKANNGEQESPAFSEE